MTSLTRPPSPTTTTSTTTTPEEAVDPEAFADLAALTETFAQRADGYDRTATFPAEDFDDLFNAGLHAPTVPVRYGGMGIGPLHGETYALWQMTKTLASADLSLARCWEGHTNSLVLIDALGSDAQKARWFAGVVRRG